MNSSSTTTTSSQPAASNAVHSAHEHRALQASGVATSSPAPVAIAHLAPASSQSPLNLGVMYKLLPACAVHTQQTLRRQVEFPALDCADAATDSPRRAAQQNSARFCFLFSHSKVTEGGGGAFRLSALPARNAASSRISPGIPWIARLALHLAMHADHSACNLAQSTGTTGLRTGRDPPQST
jgi:hypothetical protein